MGHVLGYFWDSWDIFGTEVYVNRRVRSTHRLLCPTIATISYGVKLTTSDFVLAKTIDICISTGYETHRPLCLLIAKVTYSRKFKTSDPTLDKIIDIYISTGA